MVRCLPLWAIFMGFFSHFWLCTIILTYLPTYISTVLHVNIRDVSTLLYYDPDNNDCHPMLSVIFQWTESFNFHNDGGRGSATIPIPQQWNWTLGGEISCFGLCDYRMAELLCTWVLNHHNLLYSYWFRSFPQKLT